MQALVRQPPWHLDRVRSTVAGVAWPPAVTDPQRAQLLLTLERLERSQWLPPEELAKGQHGQLRLLARHAAEHSPLFARRLKEAALKPDDLGTPEGLRALPTLRRADLQRDFAEVVCKTLPEGHAPTHKSTSSGSTGEPVTVVKTAINGFFWRAQTLRWHFWSGEDRSHRMGIVRFGVPEARNQKSWGAPFSWLSPTGPAYVVDLKHDFDAIGAQLAEFDPQALLIYPNVMSALIDRIEAGTLALPSLKTVRFVGEMISDELRERTGKLARVSSCYSTAEMGYLALQCPVSGLHHMLSETSLVELIDAEGNPVGEGETGRVVATDLHNFATPMVRYEIGDWAERGPACPCGRGLPTISRIRGRSRNMMSLPDGGSRWPYTGSITYRATVPVNQVQMIQHERDRLELRYTAAGGPLDASQTAAFLDLVQKSTHPDFRITLTYVEGRLDNPKNGKFEEFVSRIA